MNNNNFDDFLKDSFSDYSPDVPTHIWDNIAAQQKKKRPAGFWLKEKKALLILAALLFVGGGAYLLFNQKADTQNIAHENNGSRQETGNTATAAVPQNELDDKKQQGVAGEGINTLDKSASALPTTDLNLETGKGNSNEKTAAALSGNNNQSSSTGIRTEKKKTVRPVFRRTKNNAATNTLAASAGKAMNDDISADNNADDNTTSARDVANAELMPGNRDIISLLRESFATRQKIKAVQNSAIKISEECPGNPSGNQSYFEAYISPDYAMKKYSDTANSSLVLNRKGSMRFSSAYSAGLRYTKVFSNGMSIRAGLNFSQINEKFSYAQGNVVQIIYVINNLGDTTDSYYVRGTRYRNSSNRYSTIDLPVAVGYEMGNTNFHANINAGPVINIYSWQSGETIGTDGSPVKFGSGNTGTEYQYKTNIGIGFVAAASLYYKFSDKLHLLAEPYLRYNFAPINRETLSIQEKFTTIGLRLGIRVDLK